MDFIAPGFPIYTPSFSTERHAACRGHRTKHDLRSFGDYTKDLSWKNDSLQSERRKETTEKKEEEDLQHYILSEAFLNFLHH